MDGETNEILEEKTIMNSHGYFSTLKQEFGEKYNTMIERIDRYFEEHPIVRKALPPLVLLGAGIGAMKLSGYHDALQQIRLADSQEAFELAIEYFKKIPKVNAIPYVGGIASICKGSWDGYREFISKPFEEHILPKLLGKEELENF